MEARLISSSTGRNIDRLVAKVAPITAGVGPENYHADKRPLIILVGSNSLLAFTAGV